MKSPYCDFNWHDEEVIRLCREQLAGIMSEFTLTAEGESKKRLTKGRGVLTGTLRRSVHGASGAYEFSKDNVEPSESSPERGNQAVVPLEDGNRILCALGSGLIYAMRIHQGWGSFAGYHYITEGVEIAKKEKLKGIVERHQVK